MTPPDAPVVRVPTGRDLPRLRLALLLYGETAEAAAARCAAWWGAPVVICYVGGNKAPFIAEREGGE